VSADHGTGGEDHGTGGEAAVGQIEPAAQIVHDAADPTEKYPAINNVYIL